MFSHKKSADKYFDLAFEPGNEESKDQHLQKALECYQLALNTHLKETKLVTPENKEIQIALTLDLNEVRFYLIKGIAVSEETHEANLKQLILMERGWQGIKNLMTSITIRNKDLLKRYEEMQARMLHITYVTYYNFGALCFDFPLNTDTDIERYISSQKKGIELIQKSRRVFSENTAPVGYTIHNFNILAEHDDLHASKLVMDELLRLWDRYIDGLNKIAMEQEKIKKNQGIPYLKKLLIEACSLINYFEFENHIILPAAYHFTVMSTLLDLFKSSTNEGEKEAYRELLMDKVKEYYPRLSTLSATEKVEFLSYLTIFYSEVNADYVKRLEIFDHIKTILGSLSTKDVEVPWIITFAARNNILLTSDYHFSVIASLLRDYQSSTDPTKKLEYKKSLETEFKKQETSWLDDSKKEIVFLSYQWEFFQSTPDISLLLYKELIEKISKAAKYLPLTTINPALKGEKEGWIIKFLREVNKKNRTSENKEPIERKESTTALLKVMVRKRKLRELGDRRIPEKISVSKSSQKRDLVKESKDDTIKPTLTDSTEKSYPLKPRI